MEIVLRAPELFLFTHSGWTWHTDDDIVEFGVLLSNPADFAGLNETDGQVFATDPPARHVAKLGVELPGVLVSIRMTAITS